MAFRPVPKAMLEAEPRKASPHEEAWIQYVLPFMNKAVKKAENNPKNFGVLGAKTPEEANRRLDKSTANNFMRWIMAREQDKERAGKYVDFYQQRWAPIGATNDPTNLNINWAPNVRKSLQQQLGPGLYEQWKKLNLVKNPNDMHWG